MITIMNLILYKFEESLISGAKVLKTTIKSHHKHIITENNHNTNTSLNKYNTFNAYVVIRVV